MYEARQNKEKVSRRIEGTGGVRQGMQIEDGKNIKSKETFMSPPFINIVQKYSENNVYFDDAKKQEFADKRISLSLYSWSSLSKNVAYSEDYSDIAGNSNQSAHAERNTFDKILRRNNTPGAIRIATERKPCSSSTARGASGCKEYFSAIEDEDSRWSFTFDYLVNDDNAAQDSLYTIYRSTQPPIPEKRSS